jgi:hypothetical protein
MEESVAHTQRPAGIFFYSCHRLERFLCFLLDAKGIGCCVEAEEAQGSFLVDLMNGFGPFSSLDSVVVCLVVTRGG